MKEALHFLSLENNIVQCMLCPHKCKIKNGYTGICNVRKNVEGKLYLMVYNRYSALHFDPVEKKPLYHFYPGQTILSLGSIGCNLSCRFCQNHEISKVRYNSYPFLKTGNVEDLINIALKKRANIGISFTYNEPVVWFEFMLDIAKEAKKNNLCTAMISNGYINPKPLDELIEFIDAFSIDLKSFSNRFYKNYTSSDIHPVKENLKRIKEKGKLLEVTNLVIPTLNDGEKEFESMVKWIADETGKDTVFHISRYFPNFKMDIPPTPTKTLNKLFEIASGYLDYVYLGNVISENGNNTFCPNCGNLLIKRFGYTTSLPGIKEKSCNKCLQPVMGVVF